VKKAGLNKGFVELNLVFAGSDPLAMRRLSGGLRLPVWSCFFV
jgi:hypothetical protein